MPRARSEFTASLPQNLYVNKAGYYYYKNPVSRKALGLKRDRDKAIEVAVALNAETAAHETALLHGRMRSLATARKLDDSGLVNLEFLRSNCTTFQRICGIYFLLLDGEVTYIGQSINCMYRISVHISEAKKEFNSYYVVQAEPETLSNLEAMYIAKFKPKYNVILPKRSTADAWHIEQRLDKF